MDIFYTIGLSLRCISYVIHMCGYFKNTTNFVYGEDLRNIKLFSIILDWSQFLPPYPKGIGASLLQESEFMTADHQLSSCGSSA